MPPQRSIADFQLSEAEWAKSTRSKSSGIDLTNESSPTMKIVGLSDDVKAFFKKCNGTDADYLKVRYNNIDSVLWVMERIEKIIRVPMDYLALAGDGMVYTPGHLLMGMKQFKKGSTEPELILLPSWEYEDFLAVQEVQAEEEQAARKESKKNLPKDPFERAKAEFGLFDPIASSDWKSYNKERTAAEEIMENLEGDDETEPLLNAVKDSVRVAFGSDLIGDQDCEKIVNAVSLTGCDITWEDMDEIRSADIISRIHSVTSPKSVDVHFTFHHRTRWSSVEWMYALGFKINDKPVEPIQDYPNSTEAMHRMHRKNGWKPFGWFYLDDRRAEHSQCNVKHQDLKNIHDAIFGPGAFDNEIKAKAAKIDQTAAIGKRVTLQDTAKLVLGAIGIEFEIAVRDDEVDGRQHNEIEMDIVSEKPGISAAHLRKICKIPLFESDDTADLSKVQVTEPLDPDSEDEDRTDEDERDYW